MKINNQPEEKKKNWFQEFIAWIKKNNANYGRGWMTIIKSVPKNIKQKILIREDLANHIIYGEGLYVGFRAIGMAPEYALFNVIGIGIGIEAYDYSKKGWWSWLDLIATILFPTLTYLAERFSYLRIGLNA